MLTPNLMLKALSYSDSQGKETENESENHWEREEMNYDLPTDRRESG